jgi:hypothetical protein
LQPILWHIQEPSQWTTSFRTAPMQAHSYLTICNFPQRSTILSCYPNGMSPWFNAPASTRTCAGCRPNGHGPSIVPLQGFAAAHRTTRGEGSRATSSFRRSQHSSFNRLSPGGFPMNPQLLSQLRDLRLSGIAETLPVRLEQARSAPLDQNSSSQTISHDGRIDSSPVVSNRPA